MSSFLHKFNRVMAQIMVKFFLIFIGFYQQVVSPFIPARCRFYPTCSQYGRTALHWHGAWRGLLLTSARIGRCHPLGDSGIDFVPLPLYRFHYEYVPPSTANILYHGSGIYRDTCHYGAHLNGWLLNKQ